jgi:hypothetical protein
MNLLVLGAVAALAFPAPDTGRIALELRGGGSVGEVRASAASDWIPGPAFRIGASFAATSFAELHAGWSRNAFGCSSGFCRDTDVRFTGSGLDFGGRLHASIVWAGAGLVYHALRSESVRDSDRSVAETDAALGWHAGAGLAIPVMRRIVIVPGIRYATYSAGFAGEPADAIGYLIGDVGLRINVW